MPIIEGADMSSISTDRELLPEGEYLMTILTTEMSDDNKALIIKRRIESAPEEGQKFVGQESWDWLNLFQQDGKRNEMSWKAIKSYLEAVFGKGSPESNSNDTDPLHGAQVRLYIVQKSGKKKEGEAEAKVFNNVKHYSAA